MSSPSPNGMPWEPPSPEELHRLLPQYEISRLLGRGGMGAVYQGRQTRLQRDVAIKLLPASLANDPDGANFAARFEREARAMAKLDHPSIVSVYDFGQTIEGQLYFVMEYVDGMDIHRFLRHHGGWLSQGDALAIIAHVLDALVYAHGQGIIHRDIKPENILLSSTGQVKIADFGLAKVVSTPGQEAAPALTATEVVLGTLAFIAPEVLEGRKTVDQRADLYAVGVMLYQMLTGRVPHGRFKLPSQLRRELDPRLDAIIVKATEADPEHRYPTASAIRADVDKVLSGPLPESTATVPVARRVVAKKGRTRPVKSKSNTPIYVGVSLGCVAVVAVITVMLSQGAGRDSMPAGTMTAPSAPTTLSVPEPKSSEIVAVATQPETNPAPMATEARLSFLASGGMEMRGTFTPSMVNTSGARPASIRRLPDGMNPTEYGEIKLGAFGRKHTYAFVIDRLESDRPRIIMDGNSNGDLADDPLVLADEIRISGSVYPRWDVHVKLNWEDGEQAGRICVWRPPPSEANNHRHCLVYYSDYGRVGTIVIGGKRYKALLSDFNCEGDFAFVDSKIHIDINGDDRFSTSDLPGAIEAFRVKEPFEIGGDVYEITGLTSSGASFQIIQSDRLPNVTEPGPAPPITPPPPAATVATVASKPTAPATTRPSPIILPGLKLRVDRYLDARRAQIDELAAKYQRAVDKKLGEAANAGNLKLATAYRGEKTSVENFRKAIAQVAVDPLEAVFESTDLPALSPDAPPVLRSLRSTWDVEQQKVRDAVDAQLRQSLKALEAELTKAQDLANAEAVLAVRESLGPVATRDQPFENHLGMRFVPVPITGGPTDGKTVLFSVWETRVKDYVRFANEAGRVRQKTDFPQGEDHPAAYISWEDAVAFCEWLTKVEVREGKIGPADVYRLPTDHEWSCAIGIGKDEDPEAPPMAKSLVLPGYPWGEAFPPPESAGNYNGEESSQKRITGYTDAFEFTAPVGSFRPNEFGLYDLGGNVEEWCLDRAHSQNSGPRVFRGGSWGRTSKSSLQSSSRGQPGSIDREPEVGFRVVLVPGRMAKPVTSFTASRNKPFENHVGMKFVPVPITGGPSDGKVILASIWETRVQDYNLFVTESTRDWPAPNYPQGEDHPAVNVNWEDAVAFCVWMTNEDRRSGRIGPNDSYRLPTDHEWSCAVGIGKEENAAATPGSKIGKVPGYPWGASFPPPSGAGNFFGEETKRNPYPNWKPISGYDDGYDRTAPVGRFTPSASGLFDLSGNVYEWCQDRTDPAFDVCVLRGGSWFICVNYALRSSYRVETPSERSWNFGFRTVLEIGSGSPYLTAELFENRLGMKFLPVPITGGPSQGRTILFSIWETRVQDYRAFFNDTTPTRSQPDFAQDGDHPMVNVRWKDAMAFCAWLTERERAKGKIGPGDVYRLPTDHEWSCAIGLGREEDASKSPYAKNSFTHPPDPGSIERFPWGETYPPPAMAGNYYGEETNRNPLPKYAALKGYNDGFVRTAPVGSFGANPLGLHDLGGNVSEWCLDLYDPGKVSEPRRVLRGASWSFQFVPDLRSAARYDVEPEFWNPSAGFRVFLEVGGE